MEGKEGDDNEAEWRAPITNGPLRKGGNEGKEGGRCQRPTPLKKIYPRSGSRNKNQNILTRKENNVTTGSGRRLQ